MRVAVHAKVLTDPTLTGIGYYALHLLRELVRLDRESGYVLYSHSPLRHQVPAPNCREQVLGSPAWMNYLKFPDELDRKKFDLMFVPKQVVPILSKPPCVMTVHDLAGLEYPREVSVKEWLHYFLTPHFYAGRVSAVLADSESTRQQLLEASGIDAARVHTVPLGHDPALFRPMPARTVAAIRKKYGLRGSYFINTSSFLGYRKNLPRLLQAFHLGTARKRLDHHLVITGDRGPSSGEVRELIVRMGLRDRVMLLGYVPREEMPVLLSGADALVFPSLSEGFGLPVVEAMACGCPVITSDRSSLPEVAGRAGLLVPPLDVSAIAHAMERVAQSPTLRKELGRKGRDRARLFTWERTALKTLEVFRQVAGEGKGRS